MTKVVAIKREIEPPIKAGVEPGRPKKGAKLGKARDIIAKRDRRRKEPGLSLPLNSRSANFGR